MIKFPILSGNFIVSEKLLLLYCYRCFVECFRNWSWSRHNGCYDCTCRSIHLEYVWKECHISSTLDCLSKLLLIWEGNSWIVSWNNTIKFREVLLQQHCVLVIDLLDTSSVDRTYFFLFCRHRMWVTCIRQSRISENLRQREILCKAAQIDDGP